MLQPTDPQWTAMWDALARATGDRVDLNPESGEAWQYMGTYQGRHEFRHRHRPTTARPIFPWGACHDRVYLDLDVDTLRVLRVTCRTYDPPAGFCVVRNGATADPPANREATDWHTQDYGGAFDGIRVISDADPGL